MAKSRPEQAYRHTVQLLCVGNIVASDQTCNLSLSLDQLFTSILNFKLRCHASKNSIQSGTVEFHVDLHSRES